MRAMSQRRRALIPAGKPQRLSSLRISGEIPTGILSNTPYTIEVSCSFASIQSWNNLFGSTNGSTLNRLGFSTVVLYSDRVLYIWYGANYDSVSTEYLVALDRNYVFSVTYNNASFSCTINNWSRSYAYPPVFSGREITLFSEDSGAPTVCDFSYCRITKNNQLVYSSYPVQLGGRYGIYDEISDSYIWL